MISYVDKDGNYLGSWDKDAPENAIPVSSTPQDARQVWDFETEEWGPVPLAVPASIKKRSGELALIDHDLHDSVLAEIDAIEDAKERAKARVEYAADTWERANPWIDQLGSRVGLTPEDIDRLFIYADATYGR